MCRDFLFVRKINSKTFENVNIITLHRISRNYCVNSMPDATLFVNHMEKSCVSSLNLSPGVEERVESDIVALNI